MGTYIARADVEAVFGVDNVEKWADLDNDQDATKITNRITDAISFAEGLFEGRLRQGRYALPLTVAGSGLDFIQSIVSTLAGDWLYRARGLRDEDETNRIRNLLVRTEKLMGQIATGVIRLDSQLSHDGPTHPEVIR